MGNNDANLNLFNRSLVYVFVSVHLIELLPFLKSKLSNQSLTFQCRTTNQMATDSRRGVRTRAAASKPKLNFD